MTGFNMHVATRTATTPFRETPIWINPCMGGHPKLADCMPGGFSWSILREYSVMGLLFGVLIGELALASLRANGKVSAKRSYHGGFKASTSIIGESNPLPGSDKRASSAVRACRDTT